MLVIYRPKHGILILVPKYLLKFCNNAGGSIRLKDKGTTNHEQTTQTVYKTYGHHHSIYIRPCIILV